MTPEQALEAIRLLRYFAADDEPCLFASSMQSRKFEGMSCREYMTYMQGVPHAGCLICQTKEFLTKVAPK